MLTTLTSESCPRHNGVHSENKSISSNEFLFQDSKRSSSDYQGRTDGYTKVILPKLNIDTENELSRIKPGDYCQVEILDASSEVLFGRILNPTTIQNFYQNNYEVLHKYQGSRTM